MKLRLVIDRFEGDKKELAVLLAEDGRPISVPRDLLPKGARAGEALAVSWDRDVKAAAKTARKAKAVREELNKTDPGGDIKL